MKISSLFKSRGALALLLSVATLCGAAQAAPAEDPKAVAQKVYAQIKGDLNADLSDSLVNQYFDTQAMATQSLGLPYRNLSADQKTAYSAAFDGYFKRSLFHVLTTYKDVTISDLSSRVEDNRATVRCVVKPSSGQPVDLALKLSLQADSWRANDVVVDNISLIVSYRPQFTSLFKQSGFDGLVAYLKAH